MKTLQVIIILIAILLVVLLLILILPFKYRLSLRYKDDLLTVSFLYMILHFDLSLGLKSPVTYKMTVMNKKLFDSEKSNNAAIKENDTGEEKTTENNEYNFESSEPLKEDVKKSKELAKDLFIDAKKLEEKQKKDYKALNDKVDTFIDKVDSFIPHDMIYVVKKIVAELKRLIGKIAPNKVIVDVTYGIKDPYMMGVTYASLVPLIAASDGDISVYPKFLTDEFEGVVKLSKRVPIITIAFPVIRLLLDKRFREVVFKKDK